MGNLINKKILIIGGSSGIGRKVAEMAAKEGADLIIVGRNKERLDEAGKMLLKLGHSVETYAADAHDELAMEELFGHLSGFDHLVSMVGDVMGGGFLKAAMKEIRHVIDSKFFSNVLIGKLAAGKIAKGGSMVFTSGTGGRAQHACGSYVGNLGINALVEGLAAELAPHARVNAVSPTWTVTPFWRDLSEEQLNTTKEQFEKNIPLKRTAKIEELAETYIFLMKNDFITGQHIAVDGGVMLGN